MKQFCRWTTDQRCLHCFYCTSVLVPSSNGEYLKQNLSGLNGCTTFTTYEWSLFVKKRCLTFYEKCHTAVGNFLFLVVRLCRWLYLMALPIAGGSQSHWKWSSFMAVEGYLPGFYSAIRFVRHGFSIKFVAFCESKSFIWFWVMFVRSKRSLVEIYVIYLYVFGCFVKQLNNNVLQYFYSYCFVWSYYFFVIKVALIIYEDMWELAYSRKR